MMTFCHVFSVFLFIFSGSFYLRGDAGHLLVFPGEYSHWLNMRHLMEELLDRNHSITVLVSAASPSVDYNRTERFHFLVFPVPYTRADLHGVSEDFINYWMFEAHNASVLQTSLKVREIMTRATKLQLQQCDAMLLDRELLGMLRAARFDAVVADPMMMCSDLVADLLELPLVVSLRFSFGHVIERHCGQMPAPLSYVPSPPLTYSDKMTFSQRVINAANSALHSFLMEAYWCLNLDGYYSDIKGRPTTACETIGKADIWLIRTFWDIEFPRPLLPNFKFVGGLHCKPAKPLPEDMEEFVQSSGDNGVVVFSFGSIVNNLTQERGNVIATALGQIPQKVLWRYSGQKPDTLAPNTRLYDWIPQNDLLGHPKTKAFLTHGGTNGLYEAIYHAVPVVGVPLFADQPANVLRLETRGAAVMLDFNHMTSKDLVEALGAVIHQPSYKENIERLSRIHHDQPTPPLQTAAFWVEFVMRHSGAKHLRVQSHQLNWLQYHSLDVVAALVVATLTFAFAVYKSSRCCLRWCFARGRLTRS